MKLLKTIVIVIVVFIATPFVFALFVKKDYAVEREIIINKPKQEVFDYLKYIKNQDHFSKWNLMDPNMKKSYKGTDGQVGFCYAWESQNKKLGSGEQQIVKIDEGKRLDFKLLFTKPMKAEDDTYFITESIDSTTTKVKWGFTGSFSYPFNLMQLMFDMDKQVGPDFETGLKNLKGILEKNN